MDLFGVAKFWACRKASTEIPFSTCLVQQFAQEMTRNWTQFVYNTVHFNFHNGHPRVHDRIGYRTWKQIQSIQFENAEGSSTVRAPYCNEVPDTAGTTVRYLEPVCWKNSTSIVPWYWSVTGKCLMLCDRNMKWVIRRQVFCKHSEKKAKGNNTWTKYCVKRWLCVLVIVLARIRLSHTGISRIYVFPQPFRLFLPDITEEFYWHK